MTLPPDDNAQVPLYQCPACGQLVAAEHPEQNLLQCFHCNEQFFVPTNGDSEHAHSDEDEGTQSRPEPEFDDLHIKQITRLKRGAIRTQSWWIIAAGAALVSAAQLIWMTVNAAGHGPRTIPVGYAFAAVLCLLLCGRFVRRAIAVARHIREMKLPDPSTPPDFSTLSDGSQRWINLQKLSDPDQE